MNYFQIFSAKIYMNNNMNQIASQYINSNQGGKRYCPFCKNKNPTLVINESLQFFDCSRCLSCGSLITLTQKIKNFCMIKTLDYLSTTAGLQYNTGKITSLPIESKNIIREILNACCHFYHSRLDAYNIEKLKDIGISPSLIDTFLIGQAGGEVARYLVNEMKFPEDLCKKSGIINTFIDDKLIDFFEEGVVLPNFINGKIIGLTCKNFGASVSLEIIIDSFSLSNEFKNKF